MSRDIPGSANQFITWPIQSILDDSDLLTVAFWFNTDTVADFTPLVGLFRDDIDQRAWAIWIHSGKVRFDTSSNGTFQVNNISSLTSPGTGSWIHIMCTHETATPRNRIYYNGVLEATGTTNVFAGIYDNTDNVNIGGQILATAVRWADGRFANLGIWHDALGGEEALALAKGVSPRLIRPASLVGCLPLYGVAFPEIDLGGNSVEGVQNGTVAASPSRPVSGPPVLF